MEPLACLAASVLRKPLATIIQSDMHPSNKGFIWWKKLPADVPAVTPLFNTVLAEHDLASIARLEELYLGDVTLVLGMPETDPIPEGAAGHHIGPILWRRGDQDLPDSIAALDRNRPMIWIYSGHPRYGPIPTWADSDVILRSCVPALEHEDLPVILSTGYQELPDEFSSLPANFHFEPFVPGLLVAEMNDLLIHHGGYGSCQTGLFTGTPAVIVPTMSERESNARRIAAAGSGELVSPIVDNDGLKSVQPEDLLTKVRLVLGDPSYSRNARLISEKMKSYGGPSRAASLIEDLKR